jgi:hypothetical protein
MPVGNAVDQHPPAAEHDPARAGRCERGIDPLRLRAALEGVADGRDGHAGLIVV